uniref:GATA zinc finger domain-containing protein n=1 Tax=Mycena chlorophos TaxID=658473 RepID=A0ABQ0LWI7_MYCCL|nr:GATA zinc finger domain-containing protein [Mycena chlorophos]
MSDGNPYISKYSSLGGALGPYGPPGSTANAPPQPPNYPSSPNTAAASGPVYHGQGYATHPHPPPQNPAYGQYGQPSPSPHPMIPSGMVGYPHRDAPAYPSAVSPYTMMHGAGPGYPGYPAHIEIKSCANCRATSTPLWRRDPKTHETLCNACGLYLQQRNSHRPPDLIAAEREYQGFADNFADSGPYAGEDSGSAFMDGRPVCSHCGTRETSVWRRNEEGDQVCNACGVYKRLKGKDRPLSLRRDKVKPRAKHSHTPS